MRGAETWQLDSAINSLVLWWQDAGLHTLTHDESTDWRAREDAPAVAPRPEPLPRAQDQGDRKKMHPSAFSDTAHDSLPAFLAWLEQDEQQPESGWSGPRLFPPAVAQARLMVVCDAPNETGDSATDPATDRIVKAMLTAIGLAQDGEAQFATLAYRYPAGGFITQEQFEMLGARFRDYLALARPRALLILGDRAARALAPDANDSVSETLQLIKHNGVIIPTAVIAHPALLMRRPKAKAESWKVLRHLAGVVS